MFIGHMMMRIPASNEREEEKQKKREREVGEEGKRRHLVKAHGGGLIRGVWMDEERSNQINYSVHMGVGPFGWI